MTAVMRPFAKTALLQPTQKQSATAVVCGTDICGTWRQ